MLATGASSAGRAYSQSASFTGATVPITSLKRCKYDFATGRAWFSAKSRCTSRAAPWANLLLTCLAKNGVEVITIRASRSNGQ